MKTRLGLLAREPAVMLGPLTALLTLAVVFGLIKVDKADAVKGVVASLIPVIGIMAMRQRSSSPETVAKAAVETARRMTAAAAGRNDEVTLDAQRIAQDVVSGALGNADLAERAVTSVLPIATAETGG